MATDLIELKNLGKTSVQWLNAVGIRTLEQLHEVGSVAAFCKVRDRGVQSLKGFTLRFGRGPHRFPLE